MAEPQTRSADKVWMLIRGASLRQIRRALRATHAGVRRAWNEEFAGELSELEAELACVGDELRAFELEVPAEQRSLRILEFSFLALHSLVTSSNLLLTGQLAPSGNQMRTFAESLAMALLCSEPAERVLEEYDKDPRRYLVQSAPTRLTRTAERLGLVGENSLRLRGVARFYNQHSHASILAEAMLVAGSERGGLTLKPEFRPKLIPVYRKELLGRIGAARALRDTLSVLRSRLGKPN